MVGKENNEEPLAEEPLDYDKMATEDIERYEVETGDNGGSYAPTASEKMEGGGNLSDIKAILSHLRPKYEDERLQEYAESVTVSRVYDEAFNDKHYLLVMSYIEEHQDDADIDITMAMSGVQDMLTRAHRGMERIELLELAGIAREEEMNELAKQLGVG